MYLKGAQVDPHNILTEWKGREGKFVRTFGINDTRNHNEWRSTWDGILDNINKLIGRPGIEYEKCDKAGCGLNHVEAESLEENYQKQKPFEVTNMIDYVIDDDTHSVDIIHEVHDDDFWQKLKDGLIKYVSPMIWPNNRGAKSKGTGRANQPIIDTWDYEWVHMAFLEKDPAFGDVANVKTTCEGKNCGVQLLSAKAIFGIDDDSDNEELPMCGNCKFFVKDEKCALVQGEIKYKDLCDLHIFGDPKPKGTKVSPDFDKDRVNYRNAPLAAKEIELSAAEFENISCKRKYATIKDGTVEVDWKGKQHQLLHVRKLPHSHVCLDQNDEKHIRRWPNTSAELADPSTTTLTPLKEIPLLVRHKKNLHLVSASSCVQKILKKKKEAGIKIDDQALAIAFSECGESKGLKSSFKTCTCEKNQKMPDTEQQLVELKSKYDDMEKNHKELEAKHKAQEEKEEERKEGKRARYSKMFATTHTEEEEDKMMKAIKATEDEEDMKTAKEEYENHKAARKAQDDDPEKKELQEANKAMQAKLAEPMINSLIALRRNKLPQSELTIYETSLKAKSFVDIQTAYENEIYLMPQPDSLSASTDSNMAFPGEQNGHSLSAKSIDDILEAEN